MLARKELVAQNNTIWCTPQGFSLARVVFAPIPPRKSDVLSSFQEARHCPSPGPFTVCLGLNSVVQIFLRVCYYLTSHASPLVFITIHFPYLCFLLSVSSLASQDNPRTPDYTILRLSSRLVAYSSYSDWFTCQVPCTRSDLLCGS